LTEVELPQAQVLGELVMEPINKALQEENGRLKAEVGILKEREMCKQELMDEYKARAKNMEEENQRSKEENQRLRDEMKSLKEKEIRLNVEVEYLKRIDEQLRLERNAERVRLTVEIDYLKRREEELRLDRTAERAMFQTMMSSLLNSGIEDRKRKRDDDDETM
jgi:hypothetical protein